MSGRVNRRTVMAGHIKWVIVVGIGNLLGSMTCRPALAHDPYEIISTAYLHSNRLDLNVQMEFNTALLVAGVNPRAYPGIPEAELFEQVAPQLESAAAEFFQVMSGGEELSLAGAAINLGVENHVQFSLTFPHPDKQPLRFIANGLRGLESVGPYGTTLTVLDMVNQKVLGQPVLFGDRPEMDVPVPSIVNPQPAELTSALPEASGMPPEHPPDAAPEMEASHVDAESSAPGSRWWIWVVALVVLIDVAVLLIWLSTRGRKAR